MKVFDTCIYSTEKNLGKAYNEFIQMIPMIHAPVCGMEILPGSPRTTDFTFRNMLTDTRTQF